MVVYEIGDTAIPTVNIEFEGVTYPTANVSGTIKSRYPELVAEEVNDSTFFYLLYFQSPLVVEGETETTSVQEIWFSAQELGVASTSTIEEYVNVSNASQTLVNAKTASTVAVNIINGLLGSISNTSVSHTTVSNILASVESKNQELTNTNIESSSLFIEQQTAGKAVAISNYAGNDVVLLQEAAENIAQIQAVIDEQQTENKIIAEQVYMQKERADLSTTADIQAYKEAFTYNNITSNMPTKSEQQDLTDLTNSIINSKYILPETEISKIKFSKK